MSSGWIHKKATRGRIGGRCGPGSIFTRFGPELQSYLRQSASEAEKGFVYSMLDQTQGFAHAGIE